MDNPNLENKAITTTEENKVIPNVPEAKSTEDKTTKVELVEANAAREKKLNEELEATKQDLADLKTLMSNKDYLIAELTEKLKPVDETLVDVKYIKESCGLQNGFKCKMSRADANMMAEKGLIKIL